MNTPPENSLKQKTRKGTLWSIIERFSVQGVTFIVLLVMARLLTPEDYGVVGMIAIFIEIGQSLVDSGFSQALIRKRDRAAIDNSTVFYFNIAVGMLLYAILFFTAPLIADFYNKPDFTPILVPLIRILGLSLVINSFVVVQRALFTIELDFKSQAKASLTAALVSGAVGIGMALTGFGVWAIASQQLANLFVNVALLWVLSSWRPKWIYSWASFRELFGFGSKLAASGILETVYKNVYNIAIGKFYSTDQLGFYTRAQQFGNFLSLNVTGVIQRVTFPVLCTIQDDDERLGKLYRKFLRLSAFIIFPLMIGLAALADPLIIILLKPKWAFAATLLQILCFSMMWYPIHAINLNLLQVKGRSDLFLYLEIAKKVVGVAIMIVTIPLGLVAICAGQVVSSLIALVINTHYTGKMIGAGFFVQLKDLLPTLFYSLTMGAAVYAITLFVGPLWLQLILGVPAGIICYLGLARLTGSADLRELLSFVRSK
ncbi:MAG: lipopolysaccharide biosynthesis protein [Bacteroidales bacterium]|nr:lipopolysaccharide biosynthesis protein [Bacteroidales bacterium]